MKQLNYTNDILMKENYLNIYFKDGNEKKILVSKIRSIYIKVNNKNKKLFYLLLGFFFIVVFSVLFIQIGLSIILIPISLLILLDAFVSQNKFVLVVEYSTGANYNFPFSKKSKCEIVDELRNVRSVLDGLKISKVNENLVLS